MALFLGDVATLAAVALRRRCFQLEVFQWLLHVICTSSLRHQPRRYVNRSGYAQLPFLLPLPLLPGALDLERLSRLVTRPEIEGHFAQEDSPVYDKSKNIVSKKVNPHAPNPKP